MDKGIFFHPKKYTDLGNVESFYLKDHHSLLFAGLKGKNGAKRQGVRNLVWVWFPKARKGVYLLINYPTDFDPSVDDYPIIGNYTEPYNVFFSNDDYERSEKITFDMNEQGKHLIVPDRFVEKIWNRRQEKFSWTNRENIFCSLRWEIIPTVEGKIKIIHKYSKGIVIGRRIKYFRCDLFSANNNLSDFAIPSARMQNTTPVWCFLATRPIPSNNWGNYINSIKFQYELIIEGEIEGLDGKIYTVRSDPIPYSYILVFNHFSIQKKTKQRKFRGQASDVWHIFLKDSVIPNVRKIWNAAIEEKITNKPAIIPQIQGFSIFLPNNDEYGLFGDDRERTIGIQIPLQWKKEEMEYKPRSFSIFFSSCKIRINYIENKRGMI